MQVNEIFLGNAYELIKTIEDNSVDLIVTDPPYDIPVIKGGGIMNDRIHNFDEHLRDSDLGQGIDLRILDEFVRVLKKTNIYIFCNKEQILPYLEYFVRDRGCNYEILIWLKTDPIPFCGMHYLKDKEYCLFFWEQGAEIHIPFERGKTVYITGKNIEDKKIYGHPTIKPLEIIRNLIDNSSVRGG